jgi:hypothetical protein
MRYLMTSLLMFIFLAAAVACRQAEVPPATEMPTVTPTIEVVVEEEKEEATAVSTPTISITRAPLILEGVDEELAETHSETIRFGRALVAEDLGIEAGMLTVTGLEVVDWPDGCLGMGGPLEGCTEAIVPGLRIQVSLDDQIYEIRTDLDGRQYRWAALQ